MDKQKYIEQCFADSFQLWAKRACLWGVGLFLVFAPLDYFVTPDNFRRFLAYRAAISSILLGAFFLFDRLPQRFHAATGFVIAILSAITVELIVMQSGESRSPYSIGMVLLAISIGFVPASFTFHASLSAAIYLIYIVPLLFSNTAALHDEFLILNVFMFLIFLTLLFMRFLNGKALASEAGLRFDRERYQNKLEIMVAERTYELADAIEKLKQEIAGRKQLQDQLIQAQKMESIGRLAGGVAHDFNNILTAILSYAELLLMKLPENAPGRDHVEAIRDAGDRAALLTRQLLAFSRKQVLEIKPVDLNAVVRGMTNMLARMIGEDIILSIKAEESLPLIRADRGQIEQVIMNLAVNARDAMPHGGTLSIETAAAQADDAFLRVHADASTAYVVLRVEDSGKGMTREVRERIFEPFFTTKDVGHGTGLGLSMVYGIVKQHNGHISVESETGKGTVFQIYLPIIREEDEAPRWMLAHDTPL